MAQTSQARGGNVLGPRWAPWEAGPLLPLCVSAFEERLTRSYVLWLCLWRADDLRAMTGFLLWELAGQRGSGGGGGLSSLSFCKLEYLPVLGGKKRCLLSPDTCMCIP